MGKTGKRLCDTVTIKEVRAGERGVSASLTERVGTYLINLSTNAQLTHGKPPTAFEG